MRSSDILLSFCPHILMFLKNIIIYEFAYFELLVKYEVKVKLTGLILPNSLIFVQFVPPVLFVLIFYSSCMFIWSSSKLDIQIELQL